MTQSLLSAHLHIISYLSSNKSKLCVKQFLRLPWTFEGRRSIQRKIIIIIITRGNCVCKANTAFHVHPPFLMIFFTISLFFLWKFNMDFYLIILQKRKKSLTRNFSGSGSVLDHGLAMGRTCFPQEIILCDNTCDWWH